MHNLRVKLFLLGFGLLIPFVLLEVGLRLWGFPASDVYFRDPTSGLVLLNPNSKISIASECFRNTVITNSLGFHSKEYSLEKPSQTYRIAIIGDSFIEAQQVPLEETIASRLEEKLNANSRDIRYEVLPFGISSHGTSQNILYAYQFALQYSPDLIIDAFVMNDMQDDALASLAFHEDGMFKIEPLAQLSTSKRGKFIKKILRKSVFVTTVRQKYNIFKSQWDPQSTELPMEVQILMTEYTGFWNEAWKRQDQLLKTFNTMARENGSRFLVVSLTEGHRVHASLTEEFKKVSKGTTIDFDKPEKMLQGISQTHGFPYLALTPIFREKAQATQESTVWPCDGHWNAIGHEWGADALFKFLIQNNLLQR